MKESKHYLFVSLLFFSVFLLCASAVRAILIDSSGSVILYNGSVLSDETDVEEDETEDADDDSQSEDVIYSDDSEVDETDVEEDEIEEEKETPKPEIKKIKTKSQDEIREQKKVKIINKAGVTKLNFESKVETPDGDLVIEQPEEEFELEIEESTKEAKVKVKAKNERYYIAKAKVAAKTNFPLSVDLETNELIVTTPAGLKRVTVLPDQAVMNMLGDDIFDVVSDIKTSGDPEVESEIEMVTNDDGTLVYKIEGTSNKKFFGVIPVAIEKEVEVSTETGEVLDTNVTITNALLDAFSF